ncbi:hypothetical protein RE6C_04134 [Rhodopirellula europaea 6C]|uniref:Uncharacterized protein n=1 Tax=Rhodopirellula europaea 6C TaxID=1263867 RepID=M2AQZ3_9BACT|nr:hypothetical protein RE6C_04134 [Rhodopirellula europaea 6C]
MNSCLGQIVLVRHTSGNHSQPDFVAKQNGKTRIVSSFAKGTSLASGDGSEQHRIPCPMDQSHHAKVRETTLESGVGE